MSSHKADWILSKLPLNGSLLNAIKRRMSLPLWNHYICKQFVYCHFCILFMLPLQCSCCMFTLSFAFLYCTLLLAVYFINVNKLLAELLWALIFLISFFSTEIIVACQRLYPFFILILLVYFCLFVAHVNNLNFQSIKYFAGDYYSSIHSVQFLLTLTVHVHMYGHHVLFHNFWKDFFFIFLP